MGNLSFRIKHVKLNPHYEEFILMLIQEMEKGIIPWRKPWFTSIQQNLVTKRRYQGINVINLLLQQEKRGYQSHFWVTQKQAIRINRKIKETEFDTPCYIIMTKWHTKTWKDEAGEHIECWLLTRIHKVYNEDQLVACPKQEKLPLMLINRAKTVIDRYKDSPTICFHPTKACYRPLKDEIGIPSVDQFSPIEEYYGTLFHELAHPTGHPKRICRHSFQNKILFGDEVYASEEFIAELAASYLFWYCGFFHQTKKTLLPIFNFGYKS